MTRRLPQRSCLQSTRKEKRTQNPRANGKDSQNTGCEAQVTPSSEKRHEEDQHLSPSVVSTLAFLKVERAIRLLLQNPNDKALFFQNIYVHVHERAPWHTCSR